MYNRDLAKNIKRTIGDKKNMMAGIFYFPANGPVWSQRPDYEYDLAVFNCINRISRITGKSFSEICEIAKNSCYYLNAIEDHVVLYHSLPVDFRCE